jgi:hypothetical protein
VKTAQSCSFIVKTALNNQSIPINLWGELSKLEISEGDLVVINGARVSNFGGKSLNCG